MMCRTAHRRCQAQIVAQDTEQKHGKHLSFSPLHFFFFRSFFYLLSLFLKVFLPFNFYLFPLFQITQKHVTIEKFSFGVKLESVNHEREPFWSKGRRHETPTPFPHIAESLKDARSRLKDPAIQRFSDSAIQRLEGGEGRELAASLHPLHRCGSLDRCFAAWRRVSVEGFSDPPAVEGGWKGQARSEGKEGEGQTRSKRMGRLVSIIVIIIVMVVVCQNWSCVAPEAPETS